MFTDSLSLSLSKLTKWRGRFGRRQRRGQSSLAVHVSRLEDRILLSGVDAVDDTVSLGTNGTYVEFDVLANDSGFDLSVASVTFMPETISVGLLPEGTLGPGTIAVWIEEIPTEGQRNAWVSVIESGITDWENHQKSQIQDGYDAGVQALNDVHEFLTQWNGTSQWLVATAGNSVWALSGFLGGTAAGVAGMGLAALAAIYEGNPNVSDAQALIDAQQALINQKIAETNGITLIATQARNQLTALQASLGNPDPVADPTFTYRIEGYIDADLIDSGTDEATVTVDLGGRFDYSRHIDALRDLHNELRESVYGVQNWQIAETNITEIYGSMLVDVATLREFHLTYVATFRYANPYDPWTGYMDLTWSSSDWDLPGLDGEDIAEELNAIDFNGDQ